MNLMYTLAEQREYTVHSTAQWFLLVSLFDTKGAVLLSLFTINE